MYCERVGPEFWAEPLNAVSNIAIIISAALLIPVLQRADSKAREDPAHWVLISLVLLIGVGSGLFHTLAVRWAMWADVIPITVFTVVYAYLALRRFMRLSIQACLIWSVVMLALTAGLPEITGLSGSTYVPAMVGMLGAGLFLLYRDQRDPNGKALLIAGCIFAAALGFRTLDMPLCDVIPSGTHYFWHLLDALVLYILTRAMIQFSQLRARN
jgi:hypothetical protein